MPANRTFIIYHIGEWGSACVDVQTAATLLDAVCMHRRYFSRRIVSVRAIGEGAQCPPTSQT